MNSPFANIYLSLMARIKSQVPEIAWIDFDLGQLEAYDGDRPPVEWPCLLIDFASTEFTQLQGYQEGDTPITLRLAFDEYENTNGDTPTPVLEQAMTYLEIENKIHQALQTWYADGLLTDALIRLSAGSEKRQDDNLRVRRLVYRGAFSDNDPA